MLNNLKRLICHKTQLTNPPVSIKHTAWFDEGVPKSELFLEFLLDFLDGWVGKVYETWKRSVPPKFCGFFLYHYLFPFFSPFPPRYHIIVNVFNERGYAETPSPSPFPYFYRPLIKITSTFMKPDKIDSKPCPSCYTFILSVILSCF